MKPNLANMHYCLLLVLFTSGMFYAVPVYGDLWFDLELPKLISASVLMTVHGVASLLILVVFGAIIQAHTSVKLKKLRKGSHTRNKFSGLLLLTCMLLLCITSLMLYYTGSLTIREYTGLTHTLAGIFVVVVCIVHRYRTKTR